MWFTTKRKSQNIPKKWKVNGTSVGYSYISLEGVIQNVS